MGEGKRERLNVEYEIFIVLKTLFSKKFLTYS